MSNQWHKEYKMGCYKYAYGAPRKQSNCITYERNSSTFTEDEAAYWQAYFYKKYQGKF